MTELQKVFNEKKTENGDRAYKSSTNPLLDILFTTQYLRTHLDEVKIGDSEKEKLFAMFIRDPRYGIGERDLGRKLMLEAGVDAEKVLLAGRADDLIYMFNDEAYPEYFIKLLKEGNYFAKKWAPRLTSSSMSKQLAKALVKQMGITEKEYRKLIKLGSTVEYKFAHKDNEIDFETVPSLAMIKYRQKFATDENLSAKYFEYLESVKSGDAKLNNATMTVYDIFKAYVDISWGYNRKVSAMPEADIFFNKLPAVNLGSILPIVDNSASMYNSFDAQGKAKAVGHYVAKNSTYATNHIVSFSNKPKLIELGNTYEEDMNAMISYNDIANTDFGKVMSLLSDLKTEFPDYLLVLSDMEFDRGSEQSKDKAMQIFKEKGAQTKIIWWNFNAQAKTFPETDEYGNIFMSGYSPQLLELLEAGFDGDLFLDKLLESYAEAIK